MAFGAFQAPQLGFIPQHFRGRKKNPLVAFVASGNCFPGGYRVGDGGKREGEPAVKLAGGAGICEE